MIDHFITIIYNYIKVADIVCCAEVRINAVRNYYLKISIVVHRNYDWIISTGRRDHLKVQSSNVVDYLLSRLSRFRTYDGEAICRHVGNYGA